MSSITVGIVNAVYEHCASAIIEQYTVAHPELHSFYKGLRQFEHQLGEEAQDPYWISLLFSLRRHCFELCSVPFPANYPRDKYGDAITALSKHLSLCDLIYPDDAEQARDLLLRFGDLIQTDSSPLLTAVIRRIDDDRQTALLIRDRRFAPVVQNSHPRLAEIPIVNPSDLRSNTCFDRLIVVGSPTWFPEHVFSAPRAKEIQIVRYNWIKGGLKHESVFAGASVFVQSENGFADGAENQNPIYLDEDAINPAEVLPRIDLVGFYSRTNWGSASHTPEDEEVEARGFFLEGDWAVFLEDSDTASAMIIDLDNDEARRVIRIATRAIEVGVFILLRTEGGGDYIVPIADQILGTEAIFARQCQRVWKLKLRDMVAASGLLQISIELLERGSIRANENNLRNWISVRNIRPEDERDFQAIMNLIGLDEETEAYWKIMARIDQAHRKAGFHIRRLLLERVNQVDIEKLQRLGRMEFELQEADAGSLTAFRVEEISQNTTSLPLSKIGNPFEVLGL